MTVHYPLHPFYGQTDLPVYRRYGIGDVEHVEVELDGQRQAIPVWMIDEQQCARITMGIDPYCSLAPLSKLLLLLRSTRLQGILMAGGVVARPHAELHSATLPGVQPPLDARVQ